MKTTVEEWRDVIGFEKYYEISNLGRLRSKQRFTEGRWGKLPVKSHIQKGFTQPNGYIAYVLSIIGKHFRKLAHRLVAQAFPDICGEWFEGCQINHKNENKADNRAENLEVCDAKYNINYGQRAKKAREKLLNRKDQAKQVAQYTLDWKLIAIYKSTMDAQRKTGISNSGIGACCRGRFKQWKGYIWQYI